MLISSYINNNSQKETINMNGFRTALTVTTQAFLFDLACFLSYQYYYCHMHIISIYTIYTYTQFLSLYKNIYLRFLYFEPPFLLFVVWFFASGFF